MLAAIERDERAFIRQYVQLRKRWRVDPLAYVRQRFGVDGTPHQQEMLRAIAAPGAKVTVRSGHGTGKTSGMAMAIYWFLETHDHAKVPCTAPSAHQLYDALWGELAMWQRKADARSIARDDPEDIWLSNLFDLQAHTLRDYRDADWGAYARTARRESPDALQGFHAEHLMFCIDEAGGVYQKVFELAEGALTTPGSRVLMTGNPTVLDGTFYASHTTQIAEYTALHFRSQDSPLVAPGYREGLVRKYGEGSNVVRVRADGEFPTSTAQTLIPFALAQACLQRSAHCVQRRDSAVQEVNRLGIDVAWDGEDSTAFVHRFGSFVPHIAQFYGREPVEVCGHAMVLIEAWGIQEVYVDVTGIGAGVFSRLREVLQDKGLAPRVRIYAVAVAESAPEHAAATLLATPHRMRDYLWLAMYDWLRQAEPTFSPQMPEPYEQQLAQELGGVEYGLHSSGALIVESKDKMKKRLSRSPDFADALGCTFYVPKKTPRPVRVH